MCIWEYIHYIHMGIHIHVYNVFRYVCTCIYAHIHTHKLQVSLDPQTLL